MIELKFKNLDLYNNDGYLFKSILVNEYEKILNYYKQDKNFEDYKKFVANYFQPNSNFRSILLYHGTGTGKTPTSILIINNIIKFLKNVNIRIILPAALIPTWNFELGRFLEEKRYKDKISFITLDSPIFINKLDTEINEINSTENNILIVDECHLFFSRLLGENTNTTMIYNQLINTISKRTDIYTILLSATPCVNDFEELMYLFNFLRPNLFPLDSSVIKNMFLGSADDIKNQEYFLKRITGLVSYFEKDVEDGYPTIEDIVVKIPMSELQEKSYKIVEYQETMIKGSGSYMQKSIAACDFIVDEKDLLLYQSKKLNVKELIKNSTKQLIDEMSPKFKFAAQEFETSKRPCLFFFKNKDTSLYPFEYILEYHYDYTRFDINLKNNKPFRTFASIHGDVDEKSINIIVQTFNSKENMYGKLIKVLNITKKFSVGVTIKYLEKLIINGHSWNSAFIKQIKGRGARATTHIDLPKEDRNIKIITLMSIRSHSSGLTANEKLKAISDKKDNYIENFLYLMKIGSIDINFNINNSSFKEKKLIPWYPNFNFLINPRPFINKSFLNDIDLTLNDTLLNINIIKTKLIKVINSLNEKEIIDVLLYIFGNIYVILDKTYKTILGKIKVDEYNYPIINKGYFVAELFY